MNPNINNSISAVYRATPILSAPADAASGVSSVAWAAVAAEIARHTGASAPTADKRNAYGQVLNLLRQSMAYAERDKGASGLSPAGTLALRAFLAALIGHYERLERDVA